MSRPLRSEPGLPDGKQRRSETKPERYKLDEITNTIGLVIAVATLVGIAYPTILLPRLRPRTIKVGSAYWGVYKGQSTSQPEHLKTLEVNVADEATHKVVAGSAMYASGRAVGG